MAQSSRRSMGGLRPHLMIMDEVMTYEHNEYGDRVPATQSLPLPKPGNSPVTDEHGNVIGSQWSGQGWSAKSLWKNNPAHGELHSEAIRKSRDFLEAVTQMARDEEKDMPTLVVRQAEIPTGATVMVMWGEARGMVGMVTGKDSRGHSYFVKHLDGPGTSGLVIPEALGVVLSEPPTFDSAEAAEDWLLRSGEQEWFPGDMVRVSERRDREQAIQHGRIVKYLGIQGKEPPKYLVDIHGEPKITASYFIKGRV